MGGGAGSRERTCLLAAIPAYREKNRENPGIRYTATGLSAHYAAWGQSLTGHFPSPPNREIKVRNQGIGPGEQGHGSIPQLVSCCLSC
jgi:hypothetical protein